MGLFESRSTQNLRFLLETMLCVCVCVLTHTRKFILQLRSVTAIVFFLLFKWYGLVSRGRFPKFLGLFVKSALTFLHKRAIFL